MEISWNRHSLIDLLRKVDEMLTMLHMPSYAFMKLDADGDKKISKEELTKLE